MCVTCLFEDHDLSLLSTKHVALHTNYNTKYHNINMPYHTSIIKQDKQLERCLFNNLDLLGYL
jgi:hypothetical protein